MIINLLQTRRIGSVMPAIWSHAGLPETFHLCFGINGRPTFYYTLNRAAVQPSRLELRWTSFPCGLQGAKVVL